jgi:hypothetical protein
MCLSSFAAIREGIGSLANARRNLNNGRVSASGFVDILRHQKLTRLAERIQKHLADL